MSTLPSTLNFVRGTFTDVFYLTGVGTSPNDNLTIWFLSKNTLTGEVYLNSRPEEINYALSFSLVNTTGGVVLKCTKETNSFLGIIQSDNGFGGTTLGLTSIENAIIFNAFNSVNLGTALVSGVKYNFITSQLISKILGTVDQVAFNRDTDIHYSIGNYSQANIIDLGNQTFLNSLGFYLIPVRVYPSAISKPDTNGIAALYNFLFDYVVDVYTTSTDAVVQVKYSYCTGDNLCGTNDCYGICMQGLTCINNDGTMECGTVQTTVTTKTTLDYKWIVGIMVVVLIVISFGIIVSIGSRTNEKSQLAYQYVPNIRTYY
jgi:hypothetical protein